MRKKGLVKWPELHFRVATKIRKILKLKSNNGAVNSDVVLKEETLLEIDQIKHLEQSRLYSIYGEGGWGVDKGPGF